MIDRGTRQGGTAAFMAASWPLRAKPQGRSVRVGELIWRDSGLYDNTDDALRDACKQEVQAMDDSARRLGVTLRYVHVRVLEDIDPGFRKRVEGRAQAVLMPVTSTRQGVECERAQAALKYRLPLMSDASYVVPLGALMSDGPDVGAWAAEGRRLQRARNRSRRVSPPAPRGQALGLELLPSDPRFSHVSLRRLLPPTLLGDGHRRAGNDVGRVLKGEKPAEMPVEQPSRFILSLTLKTARVRGLALPASVTVLAVEVIE